MHRSLRPVVAAVGQRRAAAAAGSPTASVTESRRHASGLSQSGKGGRSSVSGLTTTIFGSTGFLGRYVVNEFGRIGSQVVCAYRGDEHAYRHLRLLGDLGQIIFLDYQLLDQDSVRRAVAHSDIVVNLVGQDYDSRHFSLEDANITGARNIAAAAAEVGAERLIHVSCLNAELDHESRFLSTKAEGELAVIDEFPNATIIRPANIFGGEDRFANKFASMAKLPFGQPVMDGGSQLKTPVYSGDVARGIVAAATAEDAPGSTYEFVGPTTYTMAELYSYINNTLAVPDRSFPLPKEAYKAVAQVCELSPFDPILTVEDVIREGTNDVPSRDAPGLQDLGITPVSLESVALNFLRRYRAARHHDDIREA